MRKVFSLFLPNSFIIDLHEGVAQGEENITFQSFVCLGIVSDLVSASHFKLRGLFTVITAYWRINSYGEKKISQLHPCENK